MMPIRALRMRRAGSATGGGGPFTSTGVIGQSAFGSSVYNAGVNFVSVDKFTAPGVGSVTATSMNVNIGSTVTNGGKVKPVIYSDSAGLPNTLLMTGSETILATADANTVKSLPFGTTFTFTPGTVYWIGWINDSDFAAKSLGSTGTRWKANTYASGAPGTLSGTTQTGNRLGIQVPITYAAGVSGFWDSEGALATYNIAADEVDLAAFTVPAGGCTADAVVIRLAASGVTAGDKVKGVIYTDNAGVPDALVATGAEATVVGASTELSSAFAVPPFLSSGTVYWFGFLSGGTSDPIRRGSSGARFKSGTTYASGPPNPLGATSSFAAEPGFYVTYH